MNEEKIDWIINRFRGESEFHFHHYTIIFSLFFIMLYWGHLYGKESSTLLSLANMNPKGILEIETGLYNIKIYIFMISISVSIIINHTLVFISKRIFYKLIYKKYRNQ